MKLFCPFCGIKGITKDAFYNKKVKCPGCEKPFTVECSVIVAPPKKTTAVDLAQHTDIPPVKKKQVEGPTSETIEDLGLADDQQRKNIKSRTKSQPYSQTHTRKVCSSCGARIKKGAEYTLGNGTYCVDCTPITNREEFAF
ncbi:MAG: hypothetical protein CSA26_07550 [Desulfobacterales bacterium]|nr:MAG: hypothetical protein CSA26_07550 [Desulfobacterales bacterium]